MAPVRARRLQEGRGDSRSGTRMIDPPGVASAGSIPGGRIEGPPHAATSLAGSAAQGAQAAGTETDASR